MGLPFPDGPCAGTTVATQELGCPGRVIMGCWPQALRHATTATETGRDLPEAEALPFGSVVSCNPSCLLTLKSCPRCANSSFSLTGV